MAGSAIRVNRNGEMKSRSTPDGVYLGGNQYVQRATNLAIQKVICEHKMTLENRRRKLAAVPSDLVAGLMTLHCRCEAAGATMPDVVDFWLPYCAKKIASIPLPEATRRGDSVGRPLGGYKVVPALLYFIVRMFNERIASL
jgi:hypothetical protein